MPSLRKRVSSYFRQLSFHNEPRDKKNNINENAFVTKYLQGLTTLREGPPIIYGKNPTDLPNYELGKYETGTNTIIGCYSGPSGGLTTVKRTEKHLSVPDDDIDFIDNPEEEPIAPTPKKSPIRVSGQPIDNTTMVIKVAGHEYCVTNKPKRHSKSLSLGSISDFNIEVEKTKIDKEFYSCDNKKDENSNLKETMCKEKRNDCDSNGCTVDNRINLDKQSKAESKGQSHHVDTTNLGNVNTTKTIPKEGTNAKHVSHGDNSSARSRSHNKSKTLGHSSNANHTKEHKHHQSSSSHHKVNISMSKGQHHGDKDTSIKSQSNKNYALSKSRSEGAPFQNKKRGKLIQIQRPQSYRGDDSTENNLSLNVDDSVLPPEWSQKSDHYFGVSDSLYDRNQVTKHKNGDPIADCFGVIARNDSAILAVADGVNWGEKASIAAKSAVHASLHYLNKTIFNDTKPFDKLTTKTDDVALTSDTLNPNENMNLIANTREVFVCLLRAFNCAHDLILENKGMLTTLTVAVILPLKQKSPSRIENGVRINNCEPHYVCCVCNVGDTLAYVYSQKYGIRELTKGSHDVNSNRDMRDALGALGPVDGINPELSNLTVSITTLNKGDIVMVASDGLTDNFDPNVCRFTVNSNVDPPKSRVKKTSSNVITASHQSSSQQHSHHSQQQSHHNRERGHHSQQPSEQNIQHNSEQRQQHSQPEIKAQSSSHSQSTTHKTEEVTNKPPVKPPRKSKNRGSVSSASTSERSSSSVESDVKLNNLQQQGISTHNQEHLNKPSLHQPVEDADNKKAKKQQTEYDNPLVAQFMRENSLDDSKPAKGEVKRPPPVMENKASSLRKQASSQTRQDIGRKLTPPLRNIPKTLDTSRIKQETVGYKFLKSKTALDLRSSHANKVNILRNDDGIPYITPIQRYELQLLLMEDILKNGISGRDSPITTAKKLCESLVSFTLSITSAKRRTLEDQDMYFDNRNGVLVEVSSQEKKLRRKRGLEKVQSLPGKLDHVTVVAYNVGNFSF